jgi:hypothetical protein
VLETENGVMGLSQPVQAAIPKALEMINTLIRDLLAETSEKIRAGAAAT